MAKLSTIRLGDYGTEFRLSYSYLDAAGATVVLPIAGFLRNEMTFKRLTTGQSGGQVFSRDATLLTDGLDGIAVYYSQPADFLEAGEFELEGLIQLPGSPPTSGLWRAEPVKFKVELPISSVQQPQSVSLNLGGLPIVVTSP